MAKTYRHWIPTEHTIMIGCAIHWWWQLYQPHHIVQQRIQWCRNMCSWQIIWSCVHDQPLSSYRPHEHTTTTRPNRYKLSRQFLEWHNRLWQPQLQYPQRSEKQKFEDFQNMVDEKIKAKSIHNLPVRNDNSFISRYNTLIWIFKECGDTTFGRVKCNKHALNQCVTSPRIQRIQSDIRHLSGALWITQKSFSGEVSHISLMVYQRHLSLFQANPSNSIDFRSYLLSQSQMLHKKLYNERMSEIYTCAQAADKKHVAVTLLRGSAKRLMSTGDYFGMPTALMSTNGNTLVTDLELVKSNTKTYWSKLQSCSKIMSQAFLWLIGKSIQIWP